MAATSGLGPLLAPSLWVDAGALEVVAQQTPRRALPTLGALREWGRHFPIGVADLVGRSSEEDPEGFESALRAYFELIGREDETVEAEVK
jgi:hypothetical protein